MQLDDNTELVSWVAGDVLSCCSSMAFINEKCDVVANLVFFFGIAWALAGLLIQDLDGESIYHEH